MQDLCRSVVLTFNHRLYVLNYNFVLGDFPPGVDGHAMDRSITVLKVFRDTAGKTLGDLYNALQVRFLLRKYGGLKDKTEYLRSDLSFQVSVMYILRLIAFFIIIA